MQHEAMKRERGRRVEERDLLRRAKGVFRTRQSPAEYQRFCKSTRYAPATLQAFNSSAALGSAMADGLTDGRAAVL